jgi:AbrB family looped-hinge helix DNA binding protein
MHRIATVQTRGRVTLPARIRQQLQIAPGDNVVFIETAGGRFELKAEARTAALLNRRPARRLEVPVQRRAPQLQLPLAGSEHRSAAGKEPTS